MQMLKACKNENLRFLNAAAEKTGEIGKRDALLYTKFPCKLLFNVDSENGSALPT